MTNRGEQRREPTSPFKRSRNVVRLGERRKGYLQVLVPELTLTKTEKGRRLDVSVNDDLMSIVDGAGKREFNDSIAKSGQADRIRVMGEMQKFDSDNRVLSYRFDCRGAPFRYANGGVLPVIRWNGQDYFCLFYRDIFPIGWNIANGGSDNTEEMLDPQRVMLREFGEELLVFDHRRSLLYIFDPNDEDVPSDYQVEALNGLEESFKKRRNKGQKPPRKLPEYERLPIPLKWIGGPDSVRATVRGKSQVTDGYFLNITHEDRGIEVDRIAIINLRGDVVFFDGEVSQGQILNQVVGLFRVDKLKERIDGKRFTPDRVFFHAKRRDPRELRDILEKEYLPSKALRRTPRDRAEYRREPHKFNLCPVSRNIIQRYLKWQSQQPESREQVQQTNKQFREAAETDVFVSFRTEAEPIARRLSDFLRARHHRPFFSADSLAEMGESDYCSAIDRALEAARCMVVVATRPEHFASGWVSYEWRSFLNEMHSKRKADGTLFSFVAGIEPNQLPFALRSQQMIRFSESAPQDSVEDLYRYIRQALRRTSR